MTGFVANRVSGRKLAWLSLFGVAICIVFLFLRSFGIIPRTVITRFKDGAWVKMHSESLTCLVEIKTKRGKGSTLILAQDWCDGPMLMIPSTNEDVFYCVYDYDVDFQLLRINLNQPFHALPSNGPMSTVVIRSGCGVNRVLKTDNAAWQYVGGVLEEMPPREYKRAVLEGLDLVVYRLTTDQKFLADSILHKFGGQGQYPGDPY
jgi:hypothetical protein